MKTDLRKRTKDYAMRIIRLYSSMPKKKEAEIIGKQLLRSGTSIGANYREAFRARSALEYISKIGICLQEAEESAYWLELLADNEIIKAQNLGLLIEETSELIAIFVSSINTAKAKLNT